jgi:hypothetical protein
MTGACGCLKNRFTRAKLDLFAIQAEGSRAQGIYALVLTHANVSR